MRIKTIPYYQRLYCYAYYRDGIQQRLEKGTELVMLSFFENGLICITNDQFKVGDVLILNIHIDNYPYEKLMCHVKQLTTCGEMDEIHMEIMGIPNSLNEKMKSALDKISDSQFLLTPTEKKTLKNILTKLVE